MLNNLTVYARQQDVTRFYNAASVVVNLTNPRQAIETFGLTPLEAMSCALPVIVPPVGGIAELVENGVNGYKIDVQQLDDIGHCIEILLTDADLYQVLAQNALVVSDRYRADKMVGEMERLIIDSCSNGC